MFSTIRNNESVKYFYSVFVFVLITGQSLAGLHECEMSSAISSDYSVQVMSSNDLHAGHDMSQMDGMTDHSQMSDCCANDCQCDKNKCSSSLNMIVISTSFCLTESAKASVSKLYSSLNPQVSSALFRPPIIC